MIKIKKWEDLKGRKNSKYLIASGGQGIDICNLTDDDLHLVIFFDNNSKELILATLALYGFGVEFEKPQIARWEKAKKENWSLEKLFNEFNEVCVFNLANFKLWISTFI